MQWPSRIGRDCRSWMTVNSRVQFLNSETYRWNAERTASSTARRVEVPADPSVERETCSPMYSCFSFPFFECRATKNQVSDDLVLVEVTRRRSVLLCRYSVEESLSISEDRVFHRKRISLFVIDDSLVITGTLLTVGSVSAQDDA